MWVEKGLLSLAFVINIVAIGGLTVYHVRSRSPDVYAFSAGAGELWLTVVALTILGALLIVCFGNAEPKRSPRISDFDFYECIAWLATSTPTF